MFSINLEPANEGFIKDWREKRKVEKGRRFHSPEKTFSDTDDAIDYLKTVYTGDAWPYYVELEIGGDRLLFDFSIDKGKKTELSTSDIQACLVGIKGSWKSIRQKAGSDIHGEYNGHKYDTDDDEYVFKPGTIPKSTFVNSLQFRSIRLDKDRGKPVVMYAFDSRYINDEEGSIQVSPCRYGKWDTDTTARLS